VRRLPPLPSSLHVPFANSTLAASLLGCNVSILSRPQFFLCGSRVFLTGEATVLNFSTSHQIEKHFKMPNPSIPSLLRFAATVTLASPLLAAGQNLPATPPTQMAPISATSTAATNNAATSSLPHRATVTYAAGLLNVRADNSSLNQILRQIAKLTGMTITGGVADERVFGNYGPAEPSTILATLLDGTGSNLLLLNGPTGAPAQLTITPRGGGPTPPSPDSSQFDPHDDQDPRLDTDAQGRPAPPRGFPGQAQRPLSPSGQQQPSGPVSIPQPLNNVNGSETNSSPTASTLPTTNSVPIDTVPTPSTTPSSNGIVDAPNPPAPGSTTNPAPVGPATPEQIYQQLKALQAQQQKTPPSTSPPPQQ